MFRFCCGPTIELKYGKYELGQFRATPSTGQLVEIMKSASSMGFEAIELAALTKRQLEISFGGQDLRRLIDATHEFSIAVPHFGFPFLFWSYPEIKMSKESWEVFAQCLDVARELEAQIIQILSPSFPGAEPLWDDPYPGGPATRVSFIPQSEWKSVWQRYVSLVAELCDKAKSHQIKIAVEPRPRELISNTDSALSLLRDANASNLGILLDTGHLFAMKEILPVSIWKLADSIICVQLSDNDGIIEHHWAPGEGGIDWPPVLAALVAEKYTGYLTIEASGLGQDTDFLKGRRFIEKTLDGTLSNPRVKSGIRPESPATSRASDL